MKRDSTTKSSFVLMSLMLATTACQFALNIDGSPSTPEFFKTLPPSPFESSPFGFCQGALETGTTNDYDPTYKHLNDLGTFWDRPYEGHVKTNWDEIETKTKGIYDFKKSDEVLLKIYKTTPKMNLYLSLPIYSRLYGSPAAADGSPSREGVIYPTHPDAISGYKGFIKALVTRYSMVKYWMVGQNEFDDPTAEAIFLTKDDTGIEKMAEFTIAACEAIEEVCKDCRPVIGGPAIPLVSLFQNGDQVTVLEGITLTLDRDGVFYKLFKRLEGHCKNLIVDYHFWPSANYSDYRYQTTLIDQIQKIRPGAEIWTSESGSTDASGGPVSFTEANQADNLVRTYIYALAHGQKKVLWTNVVEYHWTSDSSSVFDYMGLINNPSNSDGKSHKKLGYYTFKKMVEIFEGSDWSNVEIKRENDSNDGIFLYRIKNGSRSIGIAWSDNEATSELKMEGFFAPNANIQAIVLTPSADSGESISDYATAFTKSFSSANSGGTVEISLGRNPVVVFQE